MYDLYTSAALFFILAPGVLVTLPPGGSIHIVALLHAIVFLVVNQYVSAYVPVWGIWLIAGVVFFARVYISRPRPAVLTSTAPLIGSRRH